MMAKKRKKKKNSPEALPLELMLSLWVARVPSVATWERAMWQRAGWVKVKELFNKMTWRRGRG
jgi:hypothetical protein